MDSISAGTSWERSRSKSDLYRNVYRTVIRMDLSMAIVAMVTMERGCSCGSSATPLRDCHAEDVSRVWFTMPYSVRQYELWHQLGIAFVN